MPVDPVTGKWYAEAGSTPPPQYPLTSPPPQSGGEGYWNTGYGGTNGGVGTLVGPPLSGLQPGSPGFDAVGGAYNRSEEWFQKALARLNQDYMGGSLGTYAQGNFINPQGWDQAVIAAMKRQAGEVIQGSAKDAMQSMQAGANASGFGKSMGLVHEMDQARAGRARDISNAYSQVDINNEQAKMARQQIMQQMIAELIRAQSGQNQAAAGLMANKTEPVIPGVTPGADGTPGGGYKWLGPDGRQAPGKFPHTAQEWEEFKQERLQWEMAHGMAA